MEPSKLLDHNARPMATIHEVPFQKGRPLPSILEEETSETISANSSGDYLPGREIYMATLGEIDEDEPGIGFDDKLLKHVSADKSPR